MSLDININPVNMLDLNVNPIKYVINKLLVGNVLCNNSIIDILVEYPPKEELDCITMDDRGGQPNQSITIASSYFKAKLSDAFYDPENPDQLYATKETRINEQEAVLNLHIWGNTDQTRSCIIKTIKRIIDEAKRYNYKYCINNIGGTCKTTNTTCDAINNKNRFGIKGMCPFADVKDVNDPNYRNPSTVFEEFNIISSLVDYKVAGDADDISVKREVYHSILPIAYTIEEITEVDVIPVTKLGLSNKVIME